MMSKLGEEMEELEKMEKELENDKNHIEVKLITYRA
jgi:hypothetical protein